jgi:iron complex outermembrane receptor protein
LIYQREADVEFPALPMDNIETSFWLYSARYRIDRPAGGVLRRFELSGGLTRVDHLMDNSRKTNRAQVAAETPATTATHAASAQAILSVSGRQELSVGVNLEQLARDAVRSRRLASTGKLFLDHVWPDTSRWGAGAHVESRYRIHARLRLRLGARLDILHSSADAISDPSLGNKTVAEQYESFYGDVASLVDRTEALGAAQAVLRWRALDQLDAHLGTGFSMRSAAATERYFAFGPAPGGYAVGNPALAPEKKTVVDIGMRFRARWLRGDLGAFYYWNQDHILPTVIDERDVNGDGRPDRVRGYRNITAHLGGFEAGFELRPLRWVSLAGALAYALGRNASEGRHLPEIPPLSGRAALRFAPLRLGADQQPVDGWIELGARFSAAQKLVDERFGEDATPAFAVLRLRLGVELWRALRLRLTLENLLDTQYHEHLTREALLAAGDLSAGDEIPAPGRRLVFSLYGHL